MYTIPAGALFRWGGYGMNALFCFFAVPYALLVVHNIAKWSA